MFSHRFIFFSSFGVSGRLGFVIVAFPAYVHLLARSPEHKVRKVSYFDRRPSSRVRQKNCFIAYFSYTPGSFDLKLGRKHRGDL